MFSNSFLRNQKNPLETIDAIYDLAEEFMAEGTPISLFAAYKMLSKLQKEYPDKGFKGALGRTLDQLDKLGLHQQIVDYKKEQAEKSLKDDKSTPTNPRSKL